MAHQIPPDELKKLAQEEGINKPILSARVVGGRVELHLLGGEVVPLSHPVSPATHNVQQVTNEPPTTRTTSLDTLTAAELRQMCADLDLIGYSRLRKQELIDLLTERFTPAQLEAVRPG
jgi:hypothetical protein